MEKLNEHQTQVADILQECRVITWDSEVDGTTVHHNVELYPSDKNSLVTELFMGYHGNRVCDCMFLNYVNGAMTATDFANILKLKLTDRWKHTLGIKLAEYNPVWNVDGTEVHTVTTQYGKVTVSVDGEVNQVARGQDEVENAYGKENTSEQITDGHQNTTHGTTTTDAQTVAGTDATQLNAFNAGLVDDTKHTINEGTTTHAITGTDETSIGKGKVKDTEGGSDTTTTTYGDITTTNKGENLEANAGADIVTDKLVRSGNIGVTMTQQLLSAENSFWSQFDFFEKWFKDIAKEMSLPFYE